MVASKYAKRDLMQSEFTQRANAVPAHGLGLSVDVYSPDLVHLVHSLRDEGLQPGYLEVFKATTSAMQWVRRQLPGRGYAGREVKADKDKGTQSGSARPYVMETGLFADLSLVKAQRGDGFGNLRYHATARNFNPMMATAAHVCIAEVDELVPVGAIEPDSVHTPGNYVNMVVCTSSVKRIEQRTVRGE